MFKIAVAGTGYVGLVAGVCFAEVGHQVTCVDIDEKKVKLMESGVSPIYEADLEGLMQKNYAEGRLHYTTGYKSAYRDADAIFIDTIIKNIQIELIFIFLIYIDLLKPFLILENYNQFFQLI